MSRDRFIHVVERSHVGTARREAQELGRRVGFDEPALGRLAIVVTELGNNLVDHADGGDIFVRTVPLEGGEAVELICVDRGPGIPDIRRALTDGYTTRGDTDRPRMDLSGTGLGAVARLADAFDIHSTPGVGTVTSVLLFARPVPDDSPPPASAVGVVRRPHPRESVAGDGWSVRRESDRFMVAVVDGLGHGPEAARAAEATLGAFDEAEGRSPVEIIERMHDAARPTRGAAVAVMAAGPERRDVCFAGIGNVAGAVVGLEKHSLLSRNGTVGHQIRKLEEYTSPWPEDSLVVLHTDGIRGRWGADDLAPFLARPPALAAGALYLTHFRGTDDAAVLCLGRDAKARGA